MGGPVETARPSLGTGNPGGRPSNPSLNLYCTSYKHSYGKEGFSPCLGHHYGTGYSANLRPAVYYSPSLDCKDNPQLSLSLMDSFQSQTRRHFQRLGQPCGAEPLPCPGGRSRESGYLQLHSGPAPGAVHFQTEYEGHFVPHRPRPSVSRKHQILGVKEESGFTEGTTLQPNTFLPQYIRMGDACKTKNSMMREDFLPVSFLQGSEMLPRLVSRASRETGFTRDTLEPLACPASLLTNPRAHPHMTSVASENKSIGMKECSGFILNTPNTMTLSHSPPDSFRFLTHYQSKFCDVSGLEKVKSGWTRGGIHTHRDSGYSGRDTDRFNLSG